MLELKRNHVSERCPIAIAVRADTLVRFFVDHRVGWKNMPYNSTYTHLWFVAYSKYQKYFNP